MASAGNYSLYAIKHPKVPGYFGAFAIKGGVIPNYNKGVWNHLRDANFNNLVAFFALPGQETTITLGNLPKSLSNIVKKSYNSIDLQAGMVVVTQLTTNGIVKKFLQTMNYPHNNLVATFGAVLPRTTIPYLGTIPVYTDSPEAFVEITRVGQWPSPFGIPGAAVSDGTFMITSGGTIGFWGNGTFGGDKFIMRYQGPYNIPTTASDFASLVMEFGAENVTLGTMMKLQTAMYLRAAAGPASNLGSVQKAQRRVAEKIFTQINKLPLNIVQLTNKNLKNYRYEIGDIPSRNKYNAVYRGPLASEGPMMQRKGTLRVLGTDLLSLSERFDQTGYRAKANGQFRLDLKSIGGQNIGIIQGNLKFDVKATTSGASMKLYGKIGGSKLPNFEVGFTFSKDKIWFKGKANCVFPFHLEGNVNTNQAANLKLDAINFNPQVSVPSPSELVKCPGQFLYVIQQGAVVAYKNGVKLAGIAANAFVNRNAIANQIGQGLRMAGGIIVSNVGGEIVNVSQHTAALANRVGKDVAKKVSKKVQDSIKAVGCALSKIVGGCKDKNNPRPQNAADCNNAFYWNHQFRQCWPKGGYGIIYYAADGVGKGRCMDISEAKQQEWKHLHLWDCHANWNQRFKLHSSGLIQNQMGYCLAVRGGTGNNKNEIVLRPCKGNNANKKWRLDGAGKIVSKDYNSGNGNFCIKPTKNKNGGNLIIAPCGGVPKGRVAWVSVQGSPDYLKMHNVSRVVSLPFANKANNRKYCLDQAHIFTCNSGNNNQRYTLGFVHSDFFVIISQENKKCLDIEGKSKNDGAKIHRWGCHYQNQQRWTLSRVHNGKFINSPYTETFPHQFALRNWHSGKCLSTKDHKFSNNRGLQQYTCNPNDKSQIFTLKKY